MKNCLILLSVLLVAGLSFNACDKYESTISGTITYTNPDDETPYPADYALVRKMTMKGDSLQSMVAVRTDNEGKYLFEHNTKGTWILSVEFEKDSITYFGLSDEFTTNGLDKIEKNIQLKIDRDRYCGSEYPIN